LPPGGRILPSAALFAGNFSRRFSLFSTLDNTRRTPFFIHNGHETVMSAPWKPRNHAALECKPLNKIRKTRRVFFNRQTKNAFANSTYLLFGQTIHSVIHKDCGQFFPPRTRFAETVKDDDANLPVPTMQFKVSRFF
jgi:hypothetical protein